MTTYYVDFENGNDANTGNSFAQRWKTLTNGATAARIAAGDTIRVMASTDPVDTTLTATTIGGTVVASQTYTAATNASPIVVTKTGHGLTTGDVIGVWGDTTNTNANGLWRVTVTDANTFSLNSSTGNGSGTSGNFLPMNSSVLVLSAAQTLNIAVTPTTSAPIVPNWTASSNITSTVVTGSSAVTGIANIKIDVAAAFTTGKAAYYTLPSQLDLSAYQQVSFMCSISGAITGATSAWLRICLCSDSAGATPVHQITVPTAKFAGGPFPVTWDNAGALSSTINSIAMYVDTDYGAVSVYLSNFVACKASSGASTITHSMLIGRSASEGFLAIDYINGTDVILRSGPGGGLNNKHPNAYQGASGTFELYKVQPIKLPHSATSSSDYTGGPMATTVSGSAGSPITYSFGWNRTDMSTQTGDTYLDGQGQQPCAMLLAHSYINVVGGSFTRFPKGFMNRGSNNSIHVNNLSVIFSNVFAINDDTGSSVIENVDIQFNSAISVNNFLSLLNARKVTLSNASVKEVWASHSNGGPVSINNGRFITINNTRILGALGQAAVGSSGNVTLNGFSIKRSLTSAATFVDNGGNHMILVNGGTLEPSLVSPYATLQRTGTANDPDFIMNNVTLSNETSFVIGTIAANTSTLENSIRHENVGGVATDNRIYKNGGTIKSDTTTRHSASGIAWKLSPTAAFRTSANPLDLCLGRYGVSAGTLVTANLWVYRDNSGLSLNLVCRVQENMGITTEARAACVGTGAWEQITITFTPTVAGVIELYAEAWGGTTYNGWIDDISVTQA